MLHNIFKSYVIFDSTCSEKTEYMPKNFWISIKKIFLGILVEKEIAFMWSQKWVRMFLKIFVMEYLPDRPESPNLQCRFPTHKSTSWYIYNNNLIITFSCSMWDSWQFLIRYCIPSWNYSNYFNILLMWTTPIHRFTGEDQVWRIRKTKSRLIWP